MCKILSKYVCFSIYTQDIFFYFQQIYYGAPGHGKGLVDGMSGFGVKGPLRNAIVTTDFFFNHAADIVKSLQESQEEHRNRHYFLLKKEQLHLKECKS